MLRPIERRNFNLFIGYDGKVPGLTRIDFQVPGLSPSLQPPGLHLQRARYEAQLVAVRRTLERQGFDITELCVSRGGRPTNELIVTHPHSHLLYYLSIHWVEKGAVRFYKRLTNDWLAKVINRYPGSPALTRVKDAMEQGRLIRIAAGIQWPISGTLPPSIYFVKVSPS